MLGALDEVVGGVVIGQAPSTVIGVAVTVEITVGDPFLETVSVFVEGGVEAIKNT